MIMIETKSACDDWSEIQPEMNFKVYAVYAGNISPCLRTILNCYVFEDKHYEKLQEKLAEHEDDDEEDDVEYDDTDKPDIGDKE
jgi:hypothetical protein